MSDGIALTALIYLLAVVISMAVAGLVKLLVLVLREPARDKVVPEPRSSGPPGARPVPARHLAAISAALGTILSEHRIVHISERSHVDGWAHEGRAEHHRSHNLPRHRGR